ncbi:hypothetical protein CMI37_23650 [Candidatus Pacearchaeota archaeon]|nr:hypothetical protein [Candidatus Pacearchaeota archaeon]|tara:strand:- start:5786 stop:6172 length:387 start_codon:yes stop_codon:yes gene_type:complete
MLRRNYSTDGKRPVYLPDGKKIGYFEGDALIKEVNGSKHRLMRPPAWALDAAIFEEQVKTNAREIIIWDKETDIKYRASVEHFDKQKHVLDRGFGKQYFLMLSKWQVIEPNGNGPHQLAFALPEVANA